MSFLQSSHMEDLFYYYMEIFKLKEFEKTAEAEGHSACVLTLHTLPFFSQRVHKTFM